MRFSGRGIGEGLQVWFLAKGRWCSGPFLLVWETSSSAATPLFTTVHADPGWKLGSKGPKRSIRLQPGFVAILNRSRLID